MKLAIVTLVLLLSFGPRLSQMISLHENQCKSDAKVIQTRPGMHDARVYRYFANNEWFIGRGFLDPSHPKDGAHITIYYDRNNPAVSTDVVPIRALVNELCAIAGVGLLLLGMVSLLEMLYSKLYQQVSKGSKA